MVNASHIGKFVENFAESLVGGTQFKAAHEALLHGNTKAFAKDLSLGLASDALLVLPGVGEIRVAGEMGESISLFEKGATMRRTSQISGLLKQMKIDATTIKNDGSPFSQLFRQENPNTPGLDFLSQNVRVLEKHWDDSIKTLKSPSLEESIEFSKRYPEERYRYQRSDPNKYFWDKYENLKGDLYEPF